MAELKGNGPVFQMTREGYEKLRNELNELDKERYAVADEIEEAKSFGDLSENAEYAAAKEKQAKLEDKIRKAEYQFAHAQVVDTEKLDSSRVSVGTTVTVMDMTHNREFVYSLVGSGESQPDAGQISADSPVGRAMQNKKVGDELAVKVPNGIRKLKILSIMVKSSSRA